MSSTLQAWVLTRPEQQALRVAGLGLIERWRAALAELGVTDVREVGVDGLDNALASRNGGTLIADGGAVLEPLALEAIVEADGPEDEVVGMARSDGSTAPAFRLGARASVPKGDPFRDARPENVRTLPGDAYF